MAITKNQIFEMYIGAAGLNKAGDGLFWTSEGERISEEELKGSAELAGFTDAVLGKSSKYLPPKGTAHQEEAENDVCSKMMGIVRSFARMGDEYQDIAGNELLKEGKRRGYLIGYELGLENKGSGQRILRTDKGGLERLAKDGLQNVVSLADYRARRR